MDKDTLVPEINHDGQLTDLEASLIHAQEKFATSVTDAIRANTLALNALADRVMKAVYAVLAVFGFTLIFALAILAETRGVDSTRAAEAAQSVMSATAVSEQPPLTVVP